MAPPDIREIIARAIAQEQRTHTFRNRLAANIEAFSSRLVLPE